MSNFSFVYKSLFDMPSALLRTFFKKKVQHSGGILTLIHIFLVLPLTYLIRIEN